MVKEGNFEKKRIKPFFLKTGKCEFLTLKNQITNEIVLPKRKMSKIRRKFSFEKSFEKNKKVKKLFSLFCFEKFEKVKKIE